MWSARKRPARTSTTRSPERWATSVGTWIAGRTSRISISMFIRSNAAIVPGLALWRRYDAHVRIVSSSGTALGLYSRRRSVARSVVPQNRSYRSIVLRCSCSGRAPRMIRCPERASRSARTGRARRCDPGRSLRRPRSSSRPSRPRGARRARNRPHPSRPGRRPCAPRGSASRAPGRTFPCRACRTGSARACDASDLKNSARPGTPQPSSILDTKPGAKTRSIGPSPSTW